MNEKLGLDPAFLNEENPFNLFKAWMKEAEKKELVLLTQTEREDLISRYFLKDIKELEDRLNISLDQWKI